LFSSDNQSCCSDKFGGWLVALVKFSIEKPYCLIFPGGWLKNPLLILNDEKLFIFDIRISAIRVSGNSYE
jgi:hypothetical protein